MKAPQCVYVMRSEQFYKIGRSNDLERRIKTIRDSHHPHLPSLPVVIHTITTENPRQLEQQLHQIFRPWQEVGEWFRLGEDAVAWLCQQTDQIGEVPVFSEVKPIRNNNDDDITCLKLGEAAAIIGVEETVVRQWIDQHEIACVWLGPRTLRVTLAEAKRIQSELK